jgi:hypothetical protein
VCECCLFETKRIDLGTNGWNQYVLRVIVTRTQLVFTSDMIHRVGIEEYMSTETNRKSKTKIEENKRGQMI